MFSINFCLTKRITFVCRTNASGTTTVKYGNMKHNVMGCTVVLSNGQILRTGTKTRKSSAGYDLTRLWIGAEGTLGIVTEASMTT